MSRLYVIIFSLLLASPIYSQDIKSLILSADNAFESGNYFGAAKYYKQVLDYDHNMHGVVYKLAESYRLDNDYIHAARMYSRLVPSYQKKYPLSEFYLAEMLMNQGEYTLAQWHFSKFIEQKEDDSDEDYYYIKAERNILACEMGANMMYAPLDIDIIHAEKRINTFYSEYGMDNIKGDVSLFSSIRPNRSRDFNSLIYDEDGKVVQSELRNIDLANPYYDEKSSIVYFTISDSLPTRICRSSIVNGKLGKLEILPSIVNDSTGDNTHPTIVNTDSLTYLLYASNRSSSMGGYDIYYNVINDDGSFSRSYNWGRKIAEGSKFSYLVDTVSKFNTGGNEITPYYSVQDTCLFFSSDWHLGMGEYDIFKMKVPFGAVGEIENIGYPINSPQNDLYYRINRDFTYASFTSNRFGSYSIKHQSCCNDIYYYQSSKMVEKSEEIVKAETIKRYKNKMEELVPLTLYFDNDQPNPRSRDSISELSYDECYNEYLDRQDDYLDEFTDGLKNQRYNEAVDSIYDFFENNVTKEYSRLLEFMFILEEVLGNGDFVKMTIKGYTSPLNTPEYNLLLAKRRIATLNNFILEYKNGLLRTYLESGLLKVETMPFGESKVKSGISDNPNDKRNSVYNPLAAEERKIQVIAVKFN